MGNQPSEQDDLEAVTTWMQQLAATSLDAPPLADPSILWWKAQLLRRWDAERQAAAPLEVGERVQVGIGLVGGMAALVWFWPGLAANARGSLLMGVLILTGLMLITAAALSAWDVTNHD